MHYSPKGLLLLLRGFGQNNSLQLVSSTRHIMMIVFVLFLCQAVPAIGSSSLFWDDMNHVPETIVVDYGENHPFQRRKLETDIVDDKEEENKAYRTNLSYSLDEYDRIRIHFVTDLLEQRRGESETLDAEIDRIVNVALPKAAETWSRHLFVAPVQGDIEIKSNICFGTFGGDTVPVQTVSNTDLVVIVSGSNLLFNGEGNAYSVCDDTTLAVASPCVLDQWDRPVIGFVNFCLNFQIPDEDLNSYIQDSFSQHLNVGLKGLSLDAYTDDVAIHELGHVLAFSAWLFKFYREPDGTPRTPRPFIMKYGTCVNGNQIEALFPSSNTVELVESADGTLFYNVITPTVRQVARNHLNCQEMEGARLGDKGDCIGSHWHERLFFGEIMSPALSASSENTLSALSLALMEDSGWYKVDYRDSGTQTFGMGAGCDFVNGDCIQNDQVPSWGRDMFCDSPIRFSEGQIEEASLNHVGCDPSHRSWTFCDLWDAPTIPESLKVFPESTVRYFSDASLVPSFQLAEFCPIPAKTLGLDCTIDDSEYKPFYEGESVGEKSRCVNAFYESGEQKIYRPACMELRCDTEKRQVLVGQGSSWQVCEQDGQVLSIPSSTTGSFECPRLATVCPDMFSCPAGCSGRGVCNYDDGPKCSCFEESGANDDGCYPHFSLVGTNDGMPNPSTDDGKPNPIGDVDDLTGDGRALSQHCVLMLLPALLITFM